MSEDINAVYYTERQRNSGVYMFLQTYDAGRVQRFHTIPDYGGTSRQNLAEHSWGVSIFACEISARTKHSCSGSMLRAALTHDLAEYWSCDMPAHLKWHEPQLANALNKVQERIDIARAFGEHIPSLDEREIRVLWWADRLELYTYSRQRARAGGVTYAVVADNVHRHLTRPNLFPKLTPTDKVGLELLHQLQEALT
jgi:5'-deoxynucleotidase YfbR-like HD superfamily hydrolase